ncbi:hypothetical protein ACETU7_31355 [Rhodococcus sp. 3Y1]
MQSVTGSAPSALNTMSRALSLPGGADTSEFQPDSAPALVALALLHNGAHERAAAVVTSAIAADDASSHTGRDFTFSAPGSRWSAGRTRFSKTYRRR